MSDFTLPSGIEGAIRAGSELVVSWMSQKLESHPDMDEEQWETYPVRINGLTFPDLRIAYYVTTSFVAGEGNPQKCYMVEDCTRRIEGHRAAGSISANFSIPVDSQSEAEAMVINVLRNWIMKR